MSGANIVRIRQKKFINRFFTAGAFNIATAVKPKEIGVRENFIFHSMVENGIFISCDEGRYYLNEKIVSEMKSILENRIK